MSKWENNALQFPRLLAELQGVLCAADLKSVAESMDLEPDQVLELFDRAVEEWERIKKESES